MNRLAMFARSLIGFVNSLQELSRRFYMEYEMFSRRQSYVILVGICQRS